MDLLIRPLEANDRAAWEPLWFGYLEPYNVELAPEVTETTWRDCSIRTRTCTVFAR